MHRDLKPGNVMLTKSGVKLLDFGLAKAMAPTAPQSALTSLPTQHGLTQEGTILGTFQYMAPEQLEGKEADARTDLWAFGCVLYEMATGKKAFSASSQASLITAIMSRDPAPISLGRSRCRLRRWTASCRPAWPKTRGPLAERARREARSSNGSREGSAAGIAAPAAVSTRRRRREGLAWALAARGRPRRRDRVSRTAAPPPASSPPAPRSLRLRACGPPPAPRSSLSLPTAARLVFIAEVGDGRGRLWVQSAWTTLTVRRL